MTRSTTPSMNMASRSLGERKLSEGDRMTNDNIYALLVSVGDYEEIGLPDLPTYRSDPMLFGKALMLGLKAPQDHIRLLTGEERPGYVRMAAMARAIGGMQQLGREDTFILYYSGHGIAADAAGSESIVLSDGKIELQSVIDYVAGIPAGTKIVVIDCCYSGGFEGSGPRKLSFEEAITDFAGKGIAVIASSSADETSRLGPGGEYSIFTMMLACSIMEGNDPRREKVSLDEIYAAMMGMMDAWNGKTPDKQQHPVFRSSIGGTVVFPLRETERGEAADESDKAAKTTTEKRDKAAEEIATERDIYCVYNIKRLYNGIENRLAVFVVVDEMEASPETLARITKEIAARLTAGKIESVGTENAAGSGETDAVWCYFGYESSDIRRGIHAAYTIWCRSGALRAKYYRDNSNATVVDGIYLFQNTSYPMLKDMQRQTRRTEEIEADYKLLLALIVTKAQKFVYDLQEVRNRALSIREMRAAYGEWIDRVKGLYLRLSDQDAAPDELYDWAEAILDLAGWVADLAILFGGMEADGTECGENEMWLIDHSIRRYYEAIEKMRLMEIGRQRAGCFA